MDLGYHISSYMKRVPVFTEKIHFKFSIIRGYAISRQKNNKINKTCFLMIFLKKSLYIWANMVIFLLILVN